MILYIFCESFTINIIQSKNLLTCFILLECLVDLGILCKWYFTIDTSKELSHPVTDTSISWVHVYYRGRERSTRWKTFNRSEEIGTKEGDVSPLLSWRLPTTFLSNVIRSISWIVTLSLYLRVVDQNSEYYHMEDVGFQFLKFIWHVVYFMKRSFRNQLVRTSVNLSLDLKIYKRY